MKSQAIDYAETHAAVLAAQREYQELGYPRATRRPREQAWVNCVRERRRYLEGVMSQRNVAFVIRCFIRRHLDRCARLTTEPSAHRGPYTHESKR